MMLTAHLGHPKSYQDHVELLLQHLGVNDQAQSGSQVCTEIEVPRRVLVSASGSMEGDALGFAEVGSGSRHV